MMTESDFTAGNGTPQPFFGHRSNKLAPGYASPALTASDHVAVGVHLVTEYS
jgi:hypothetical protein